MNEEEKQEKRERKNKKAREEYQASSKFKHGIRSIESSDEDGRPLKKDKKNRSRKRSKNVYHSGIHKDGAGSEVSNIQTTVGECETRKNNPSVPNYAEEANCFLIVMENEQQAVEGNVRDTDDCCETRDVFQSNSVEYDEQVNTLLALMTEAEEAEVTEEVSEWHKRRARFRENWNTLRSEFSSARTSYESPAFQSCSLCLKIINHYAVCCKTCRQELCIQCDEKYHISNPFHHRTFYRKNDFCSQILQSNEFVDSEKLGVQVKGVPVPCFVPSVCTKCSSLGTLTLIAGSSEKFVVTLAGRYDLNSSRISCSNCSYSEEFTEKQYIQSGWWPGATSRSNYLYEETLLEFWFHLDHQYCGASTKKFIATLNKMAMSNDRKSVIDITLFDKASREYQFHKHGENFSIRRQDQTKCPACACNCCGDPNHSSQLPTTSEGVVLHKKQAVLDGNFMVPRLASASDGDGQSLLEETLIVSNSKVNNHVKDIDTQYEPGTNTTPCGGTVFAAAKETAKNKRNYKETGLLVSCCRHLITLLAVNIFCGESYRHVHYLHNELYNMGYTVFCYDVVCLYWKWAQKIGNLNEHFRDRFKHLTDKMISFLPRWHGIAHVWHCYVQNIGHSREGVGATIGEEMEQVNATLSLYGNKVKHMTEENRNDTLTAGLLYRNQERILRMPKFLAKRMSRARLLAAAFEMKLESTLKTLGLLKSDLPDIAKSILQSAIECSEKNTTGDGPPSFLMTDLEGLFVQYQYAQQSIDVSKYKKERTLGVRRRNDAKKKASKVIDKINIWHAQTFGEEEGLPVLVSMDEFLNGIFPWQLPNNKDEFRKKRELVDIWNLSNRYKEEITLCQSDMDSFLKSIDFTIKNLKQDQNQLHTDLSPTFEGERLLLAKGFIINQEICRLKKIHKEASYFFTLNDYYDDEYDQLMCRNVSM